jgi:hypothetical protein
MDTVVGLIDTNPAAAHGGCSKVDLYFSWDPSYVEHISGLNALCAGDSSTSASTSLRETPGKEAISYERNEPAIMLYSYAVNTVTFLTVVL